MQIFKNVTFITFFAFSEILSTSNKVNRIFSVKKRFYKFLKFPKIHRNIPVPECLLKKVTSLQLAFLKIEIPGHVLTFEFRKISENNLFSYSSERP